MNDHDVEDVTRRLVVRTDLPQAADPADNQFDADDPTAVFPAQTLGFCMICFRVGMTCFRMPGPQLEAHIRAKYVPALAKL